MRQKHAENIGERLIHLTGCHRSAIAGDAKSADVGIATQHIAIGRLYEQHGFDTAAVERFQHIGGAREIVSVVGQKQVDWLSSFSYPREWANLPKNSIA